MKKENLISTFQLIFALACWCTMFVIPANAQGDVTYEYRPHTTEAGSKYIEQVEVNPVVGERPTASCLRDTDREKGVDILETNEEACVPSDGTILVPYDPQSLIISTDSATYIIKRPN